MAKLTKAQKAALAANVEATVVETETVSTLANLMQAVTEADVKVENVFAAKIESSKAVVDGISVQKRNTNVTVRKVSVFYSDALKQAHVTTHLAYATKVEANKGDTTKAIAYARKDLAAQKATAQLAAATDLRIVVQAETLNVGEALTNAKYNVYNAVKAEGYTMLGQVPKLVNAIVETTKATA